MVGGYCPKRSLTQSRTIYREALYDVVRGFSFFLIFKELKEFAAKPSKFFNKSALEKFTEMSYD